MTRLCCAIDLSIPKRRSPFLIYSKGDLPNLRLQARRSRHLPAAKNVK
ncbi:MULTISPECIES: hypothetical protein [unclassified Microcoleus]|nr:MULTISPECIES: hypothetical protein [unclassified Microcoleus]